MSIGPSQCFVETTCSFPLTSLWKYWKDYRICQISYCYVMGLLLKKASQRSNLIHLVQFSCYQFLSPHTVTMYWNVVQAFNAFLICMPFCIFVSHQVFIEVARSYGKMRLNRWYRVGWFERYFKHTQLLKIIAIMSCWTAFHHRFMWLHERTLRQLIFLFIMRVLYSTIGLTNQTNTRLHTKKVIHTPFRYAVALHYIYK